MVGGWGAQVGQMLRLITWQAQACYYPGPQGYKQIDGREAFPLLRRYALCLHLSGIVRRNIRQQEAQNITCVVAQGIQGILNKCVFFKLFGF